MPGRLLLPLGCKPKTPTSTGQKGQPRPDFAAINRAALSVLVALLSRWLPGGRREGHEYVALNPQRADRHLGSFRINLRTGRWADFATGDKGGDPISLLAFLEACSQTEAARRLERALATEGGR